MVSPNVQETVSLVSCVLLLLLVPPLAVEGSLDQATYLGVSRSRLQQGLDVVVGVALAWHLLALLGGVYAAVKRARRVWGVKADARPEVCVVHTTPRLF
jgi:hypothetical protein